MPSLGEAAGRSWRPTATVTVKTERLLESTRHDGGRSLTSSHDAHQPNPGKPADAAKGSNARKGKCEDSRNGYKDDSTSCVSRDSI
jgi:hypothetical protein